MTQIVSMHRFVVDKEIQLHGQKTRFVYQDQEMDMERLLADIHCHIAHPGPSTHFSHSRPSYSVTLGAELVVNVYTPAQDEVGFVVRGSRKDLEDLKRKLGI
jgi:hypothetical protein